MPLPTCASFEVTRSTPPSATYHASFSGWAAFDASACELDLRCRPACAHGVCRDGACACEEGYGGGACEAGVCAGGCGHGGRCVAPGRCECEDGWAEAPAAALQPRGLPSTRRRLKPPPAWSKLVVYQHSPGQNACSPPE